MRQLKTSFIQAIFFLILLINLIPCQAQNEPGNTNGHVRDSAASNKKPVYTNIFGADEIHNLDDNIRSIKQDKKGNYWLGTNGNGVYLYNGKTLVHFTEKDGLADNQVQTIQEDNAGNMWFGTGGFGVSRYDGKTFTTFTSPENRELKNDSTTKWKTAPGDLYFFAGGGVFRATNNTFTYLPLPKRDKDAGFTEYSANRLSPYSVYCWLKDSKGNVWFGTQAMGVCRYNGKSFTWFTEKGLAGPAVLALFEDKNGNIWMGNNGAGLFRYDGKTLTNFTEEKGLGNKEFRQAGKPKPGTLARIYAINQDNNGTIWIGTVDAGVWRLDGDKLSNFTTANGLSSNAVNIIYKDNNGELWFGTDANGINKFNGKSFTKFSIE